MFGTRATLIVQGDTVTLTPAAVEVDVAQFERLVRRGTPRSLETALALYHGPLLDGIHVAEPAFDDWMQAERARLQDLVIDALRRLVAADVKAGRTESATARAAQLVALDPLQEDVHRTLMKLYVRQGRRGAALRQYQACVAALQKELGVEPEPETRRLYLDVLQRAEPSRASGRAKTSTARPMLPTPDAPLIGREGELTRLRQRLRTAWRGRGQTVLVTGEEGIGKSRLVEELAAVAGAQGARVLLGRAHETEQILPFRPWIDALRSGRALTGVDPEAAGGARRRIELSRLFPELGTREEQPPMTPEGHVRLFENIDAPIAEVARNQPLLVVLEDLHIGDFTATVQIVDRLQQLGETLGEIRLQAYAAWMATRVYTVMGDVDAAIGAGRRYVEIAADPIGRANALGWLGAAHAENEDPTHAIPLIEDAIGQLHSLSGTGGYRYQQIDGIFTAVLSEAYLMKRQVDRARELATRAVAVTTAGGWAVAVGYARRALARVALADGDPDAAETGLREAIATFSTIDARCQVARSRINLAELLAARGQRDAAAIELESARELFRQMRARRLLERTAPLADALGLTSG